MVSGNTTQYTWDFENRLTSVVLPGSGGTATFKYDPLGHRIQKVFTQGSTATTTNYVYDGPNDIEEVDQNANVLGRYTQRAVLDEPLAELRAGTTSYYGQDGLDSVTSLSTGVGALANTYVYDSFGNLTNSGGSFANPFQYTGRDYDPETGLRYYRARYYDSTTGRFLSEDPIGFHGGLNHLVYADNNPITITDPSGLLSVCCRRVKSTLYFGCHCFLKFLDGSTWAGYRDGLTLYLAWNHPDDYPFRKPSKCSPVGLQCPSETEDKVKKAINNIPVLPGGRAYLLQGVSSTPAGQALRDSGVPFKFPGCAWFSGSDLGTTPLHGLPWSLSGRGMGAYR